MRGIRDTTTCHQTTTRYATRSGGIAVVGFVGVHRAPIDTEQLTRASRTDQLCELCFHLRVLFATREKPLRQQKRRTNERHRTWACAAMAEPPARSPVALLATSYTTTCAMLAAQVRELGLTLHWIIYIYCLHVRLPNLHSIKSLMLFYRVMLLSLYTFYT